ncbi:MAG: ABC transporter permease [Flammeovirgaceae bacterium]|jgi:putative ABC transport system permease protein|nr:ABC transporter permease [Flammeovirgaceae bacterium]|tara:strand:- start:7723 stop:8937 length:1215 start_codon:yes stop_codon:yes gene_type:complete
MRLYIKLAWRNIWRSKKRTWITASSIAFSVFFACLMQSIQLGSYENMIDNSVRFFTGHIGIHQQDYWDEQILDNSFDQQLINNFDASQSPMVRASPRLNAVALASYKERTKGVALYGVDLELEAKFSFLERKLVSGNYHSPGGILVAQGLSEYLNLSLGDTLVLMSQGYHGVNAAAKYPVTGILKFPILSLNQGAVYLPLSAAQEFLVAPNMITSYSILLDDSEATKIMSSELQPRLSESELQVRTWQEMMPDLVQGIELDYYGGVVMLHILYAVVGFGIFGTFLMMVKERMYEFGVLNAIGMTKGNIQIMVAFEIFMLIFLGVFIGLLAASPVVMCFWQNPIPLTGDAAASLEKFGYEAIVPFALNLKIFYNQGISIFIISILLAIYPMLSIKQLKIIKALKE